MAAAPTLRANACQSETADIHACAALDWEGELSYSVDAAGYSAVDAAGYSADACMLSLPAVLLLLLPLGLCSSHQPSSDISSSSPSLH
eukprot:5212843-Prymnesium_polylepis.1